MTLEDFAKRCGVSLVKCAQSWGGRIGYKTAGDHGCSVNGFKTADEAYASWLSDLFGWRAGDAVRELLARIDAQAAQVAELEAERDAAIKEANELRPGAIMFRELAPQLVKMGVLT